MFRLSLIGLMIGLTCSWAEDPKSQDKSEGWIDLFNKKDLTGWVIDGPKEYKDKTDNKMKPLWEVTDGMIHTSGKGFGFLRYDKEFSDFHLLVEYRLSKEKDVNSGIGIRTMVFDSKKSTDTRPSFYSYEVQLLDDSHKTPNEHATGSLYRYVAPKKFAHKPAPEWNTIEIECIGPRIRVIMNQEEVINFDQNSKEELKKKPLKGYICLQSHSANVDFRTIRIKDLSKK